MKSATSIYVIMEHLASANYSSAADLATWRLYIQASTFMLKIDHQWGKVHSMCAHHVLSTAKALSIYHVTVDYNVADMFLTEL